MIRQRHKLPTCGGYDARWTTLISILPASWIFSLDGANMQERVRSPVQLKETSGTLSSHSTQAARPYVLQIREKFKNAATSFVEHLGETNWQRSVRIRQQMGIDAKESEVDDPQFDAYTASFPVSGVHESGLGTFLSRKTSSTRSSASPSACVPGVARNQFDFTRIPSTPLEVARGIPFVCFICKRTLNEIRDSLDWE